MSAHTLAIDFGTSNSAVAISTPDGIRRIKLEGMSDTLPTAVFFPTGGGALKIGNAATDAFINGADGRYMRALKSVLGQPLAHEKRLISGRYHTISGIITDFLTTLRERSEQETGQRFTKALSGRPVHFHSANADKDKQAEDDLRACYLAAGFDEVSFLAEPEAAAIASHNQAGGCDLGLIVDIGGGTSDFSVFRSHNDRPEIIASHGIRLGGTDFDQAISVAHAMPLLGLGGQLQRPMGAGLLPVPKAPYMDLATWSQIPFLYTPEMRRMVADMIRHAVEPQKMMRLGDVIEMELGHDLAFAVEHGKIDVNNTRETCPIALGFIEANLSQALAPEGLDTALDQHSTQLRQAASDTLTMAEIEPEQIQQVILVGGSSLMNLVSREMKYLCINAEMARSEAFTAVVNGLALAA
ncbi:Hsp70 family protein [Coralliovum pocilloporae]|uniref:Hsp70 family protein n=1 Tax=Coralliovum pocilloporae TaxID=3066369 RepID=UPI0033071A7B